MLNKYIAVYIPGTREVNIPLTSEYQDRLAGDVAGKLSAIFGGCTEYKTKGSYITAAGDLVREDIIICKSYHDIDDIAARDQVESIAALLKDSLSQESVTIETNAGIDFI